MQSYSDDEILAVLEKHEGNAKASAKSIGWARTSFRRRVDRIVQTAANIPDGQVLRGLSTLQDGQGNVKLRWIKTNADEERAKEARQAVHAALCETLPRYTPVPYKGHCNDDLLSVYVISDSHLGVLCWKGETGAEDWDMKIGEEMLVSWFRTAINQSPDSKKAVFAQLGDLLHWDGMDAVTPQHRNVLDADTRFAKLVRVVIRVIRQIIQMLLDKHEQVHIIMADANHDPASGTWLREWLAAVYEDDKRITVEISADSYYVVEHGLTSNFFHHGHKRGIKDVDRVMAGKFSEVFGRTKFRYAHLGHLHSDEVNETPLMRVERHRTLTAPDAYAAKGGWISGRDAKVITYSKKWGEISRLIIGVDMVRSTYGKAA